MATCATTHVGYVQRKREAQAAQRDAAFQALYDEVLAGLQGTGPLMAEVQELQAAADAASAARKRTLHQQWHSQVFDPLQVRHKQWRVSTATVRQCQAFA